MKKHYLKNKAPFIFIIICCLALTIIPLPSAINIFRPNFITLIIIYLSINFPEKFNLGNTWMLGLLVDVTMGNLLGQNALALCVISYISVKFHLQFRIFPILQMSSIVFLLVGIHQFILFWINGVVGNEVIFIKYFGPILTSTLMWPLVVILLGKFKHVLQK